VPRPLIQSRLNGFRFSGCALLVAQAVVLAACSIRPEWQRLASGADLEIHWIETGAFRHLVIANDRPGSRLDIYIEGDGLPWIRERRIAVDPTPANPLLLRMMVDDERAAVYLGRPCYFGTATSPSCDPYIWTTGRYADPVVRSMCDAANRLSAEREAESVGLIGYSGGGALAVAMRDCVHRLKSIITIAANLDVDAWTAHHNYAPLELPSRAVAVAGDLEEVGETHWQCSADENVPPEITDGYFEKHPAAIRIIVDDCSHDRGWMRYRQRVKVNRKSEHGFGALRQPTMRSKQNSLESQTQSDNTRESN
jgi:hypothetical protein